MPTKTCFIYHFRVTFLTDYEKTTIIAVLADVSGTVTLPEGITEVPEGLFYDKKGLTEVILPASLRKICAGAFDDCCDLVQLNIPEGVTEIGDYAFDSCTSLKSVQATPHQNKSIITHPITAASWAIV